VPISKGMRSQLRVRVILPVAVLGLLGIGVGAFAMGGPPGGAVAAVPTPTAPTATAPTTTPAEPAGPPSRAVWAAGANELCAKVNREVRQLGQPSIADEQAVIAWLADLVDVVRRNEPAFVALGWPRGERAAVKTLVALYREQIRLGAAAVEALKAHDQARFLELSKKLNRLDRGDKILARLGAERCLEDPFAPADPERGLAGALEENKVVVVLFYAPGSAYDTIQAREARAGAALGGAGFLAVDVSKDGQVASVATAFQVRDAPAILVVKRGFRVAVRINGFADRQTVAQAAANAR
jgi:hypothetical protein